MSGEGRVEGESMSGEGRVEGESTSGEVRVMGEQSTSNDGEEQDSTVKRPRLEDISTLAAEPLQEWLENLPPDDLRHFALLLYTTLPSKFGLQKTDTATAIADILQKSEVTIALALSLPLGAAFALTYTFAFSHSSSLDINVLSLT